MLLSAEIRLFWFDAKPAALEAWFHDEAVHLCAAGGGSERTDVYLRDPGQKELGIKTRGENPGVEVKGLVAIPGDTVEFASYQIPLEIWSKWPSQALAFDTRAGLPLRKTRWQRMFETAGASPIEVPLNSKEEPVGGHARPTKGCNVEWTIVDTASGETCWTLGFEAYGNLQDISHSLRSVVHAMSDRNPPPSPGAQALSYAAWTGAPDFVH